MNRVNIVMRVVQTKSRGLFTVLSLFLSSLVFAQSDNAYAEWIFGYASRPFDSSIICGRSVINFSRDSINSVYCTGKYDIFDLGFSNSVISDDSGKFLYFFDGFRLANKNQEVLDGGDSINYGKVWDAYIGGFYVTLGSFFIPDPGDTNKCYLIHQFMDYIKHPGRPSSLSCPKLYYTLIDRNYNNGLGKVLEKNQTIVEGDYIRSYLAVTRHANGRDWWILTEEVGTAIVVKMLLTPNGFMGPYYQKIGREGSTKIYTGSNSVFSKDGTKYLSYLSDNQIQVYDFDRCTGLLSNWINIVNEECLNNIWGSVEISTNNRFVYLSNFGKIWQYDLESADIVKSETVVAVWDSFFYNDFFTTDYFVLRTGPDNRIYVSTTSATPFMHFINNPNAKGLACNFVNRGVAFSEYIFGAPPVTPNFELGSLSGSGCDTIITGSLDHKKNNELVVFPNPANNEINFQFNNLIISKEMSIYNVTGELIFKDNNINAPSRSINTSGWNSGIYYYSITSNNHQKNIGKFVIR